MMQESEEKCKRKMQGLPVGTEDNTTGCWSCPASERRAAGLV